MKALLLKDYYTTRYRILMILGILLLYGVIFIPTSGITTYVFIVYFISCPLLNSTYIDYKSGWDEYVKILPVSTSEVVMSKYIYAGIVIICDTILTLAAYGLVVAFIPSKANIDPFEFIYVTLGCISFSIVVQSMTIALNFRFGPDVSRYMMFIIYIVVACIIFGLLVLLIALGIDTEESILAVMISLLVLSVIISIVLFFISKRILDKKEY